MKHIKLYENWLNENSGKKFRAYINDSRKPGGSNSDIKKSYDLNVENRNRDGFDVVGKKEDIEAFIDDYAVVLQNEMEEDGSYTLDMLKKLIPGAEFEEAEDMEFDEDDYRSVESFIITIPGLGKGEDGSAHGEDELYLNVYDGDTFCFFYDSAPIATSLHGKDVAIKMAQTEVEVPLPLSKLNKKIFDEVVSTIKENM